MKPAIPLLLSLALAIFAQGPSGQITGTISDSTGAIVAGAKIALTHPATNSTRNAISNTSGIYDLPALPPGTYNLKIEMTGFKSEVRNDIELQVGQVARIDFTLQVGNVSEVVEVAGGAPVLETETTSVGTVIENRRIVELPLNGRNYLQLASLIPGATTNGPASSQGQGRMGGQRNEFALNVSGQRVHYNHFTLDGIENTDPNFNTYLFLPSIDALQEFKVESGLFQAEYGRAIAQINVTTKSGTNQMHGSAFEFLRNAKLDAKNYFDKGSDPIPPFKRNQFGFTLGGPVVLPKVVNGKDKLFFFFDYEGLRERKALTGLATLPSVPYRQGDFSGVSALVYDPATRTYNGNTVTGATAFPGNRIPANRIHPTSAKILQKYFPVPNVSPNVQANNFLSTEGRTSDTNQQTGRFDYVQSSSSTWMFRYSHGSELRYNPINIPDQGNNIDVQVHQGMLGHTWVLGSNKVNDFKFGISRLESGNVARRAGRENVVADLNIPDVSRDFPLYWGVPNISWTGFSGVGEASDTPFINWDTVIQATDNFSWNRGKHSLKLGTDLRRTRYNQIGGVVPRGRFSWDGRYTINPAVNQAATSAHSTADYLLGLMSNSEGQIGAPIANYRNAYFSFYFQDAWKVSPKLTVNWGLRWEDELPWHDKYDAIVNIDFRWDNSKEPVYVRTGTGDPFEGNPAFRLPSTVQYVRDGRFGRTAYMNDSKNFAPRLGVAYQLSPKTVIRTGAGLYYVRDIGNAVFDVVRNAPFTIRRNEPSDSVRPNLSWEKPFTQLGVPTFILINQWNEPTSYVGQWSFGVQRELTRDMSLEVNYLGSAASHLRRLQTYNAAVPGPGNANNNRPYPKFGGFQVMNAPSHSNYNALQARLQQRFSKGFTLLSSFAYGKSIDNGSGIRTTDGDSLTPSNDYNLKGERGLSAFDFRTRWTTSMLYELPFGKGKALLGNAGRAADAVIGGWQMGTILTFQSGFPLTIYCGGGNIQNGGGQCYPDSLGIDPNLSRDERKRERWFNTAAFVDRLPGGAQFRYGNNGRNNVIGPPLTSWDFSANKTFHLTERTRLAFRAEFFNLPNHPVFSQPGNTLRTSAFGISGGTRVESRQVQFGLKLDF
ncbi:MAG: carboxypeptidase regulatory-like domain-containing protein [Candidatus Solibacter usitatus]|nr:carboxypeptidase regulatory-like domain-containing protein [Candidatus Solibacter usitatus]